MKLTNAIREAFIRAAMDDVPQVNYQAQVIKIVTADAVDQLPPKVKALYKDKELSRFVRTDGRHYGIAYVAVPCGGDHTLSSSAAAAVQKLKSAHEAQNENRKALREKLRACAYACSTRKALVDMLPEFEKYLPADAAAACRTLPVVANVVSDFVKAGWPKDAKKSGLKAA